MMSKKVYAAPMVLVNDMPLPFICAAIGAVVANMVYALGCLKGFYEQKQLLKISPQSATEPLWICIPARNEIDRLPKTIDHLLQNKDSNFKIFVVDDQSTDGTTNWLTHRAQKDPRLKCINNKSKIPGKPGALAHLVRHLEANESHHPPAYLFLDADMQLDTQILGALQHELYNGPYQALSGAPQLICKSLSEHLIVPAVAALAAVLYPPSQVHEGKKCFLNGQFIFIKRSLLTTIGGWESVAHEVLEDVALAQRIKDHGEKVGLIDLRPYLATRMYTSFGEVIAGFSKNILPLTGGSLSAFLWGVLGILLTHAPILFVGLALFWKKAVGLALLSWLFTSLCQGLTRKLWGHSMGFAFLSPLTALGLMIIIVKSIFHTLSQQPLNWRGRDIQLKK
jgi:chlorobactene glucosyltransferase